MLSFFRGMSLSPSCAAHGKGKVRIMSSRSSMRLMIVGVILVFVFAWLLATNQALSNLLGLGSTSSNFNYDAVMAAQSTADARSTQSTAQAQIQSAQSTVSAVSVPTTVASTGITATATYSVVRQPTLSANFINKVLDAYTAGDGSKSPARGMGQVIYDLSREYNIDDAYALATFLHESGFGTAGEARATHSLGNARCLPIPQEADGCIDQDRGGYASYNQWGKRSFEAWFKLLVNGYVKGQLGDVINSKPASYQVCQQNMKQAGMCLYRLGDIIPIYAPQQDNNDESAYISSLCNSINIWHKGIIKAW
jgi:hypothetical protein